MLHIDIESRDNQTNDNGYSNTVNSMQIVIRYSIFFGYCRCRLQLYFRRTRARSYDDGSTRCAVRRIAEFPPSRHVAVTNQISRLNHTRFFHSEVRLAFAEERDYGTVSVLLFNVLPP